MCQRLAWAVLTLAGGLALASPGWGREVSAPQSIRTVQECLVSSGLDVTARPGKGASDKGTLSVLLPGANIAALVFRSSPAQAKAVMAAQQRKAPGFFRPGTLFTLANVVVLWVPPLPRSNPQSRAWTPAMSARYLGIVTRCLTR